MWPSPASTSNGPNTVTPWATPKTFTPTIHSHSSGVVSSIRPPGDTPALLHTTCTAPYADSVCDARSCTAAGSLTSQSTPSTSAPSASSRVADSASTSSSTSAITTCIPSATNRSLIANPDSASRPGHHCNLAFEVFHGHHPSLLRFRRSILPGSSSTR